MSFNQSENDMSLNQTEVREIQKIEQIYYMKPIIETIKIYFGRVGILDSLDYIHDILRDSQAEVEKLLVERKSRGEINDISQARKSIVGSAFSNCLIYIFLKNKESGFILPNIFVTNKTRDAKFESLITIQVGEETQKPDMDLIFYSETPNKELFKTMVVSLKTSLRERAGQTYKWKLLMEIASSDCSVKDKYNIQYNPTHPPIVCFATVNFYNEINQPQHRGMFKFFDASFIGKPMNADFIANMSTLVDFVNKNLV